MTVKKNLNKYRTTKQLLALSLSNKFTDKEYQTMRTRSEEFKSIRFRKRVRQMFEYKVKEFEVIMKRTFKELIEKIISFIYDQEEEIMDNLQKQFNKVNQKIQILNNEVDRLKNIRHGMTKAELKRSRFNQFVLIVFTNTIFFILGMAAYKYFVLPGVVI